MQFNCYAELPRQTNIIGVLTSHWCCQLIPIMSLIIKYPMLNILIRVCHLQYLYENFMQTFHYITNNTVTPNSAVLNGPAI